MTSKRYPIVGRMDGLTPELIARYEMHRNRAGGALGHCNPARRHLNRILIGESDWADQTLKQIGQIRFANHQLRLAALQRRKRKKDLLNAVIEGPSDPWKPSKHGPMREMVLTADQDFFAAVGGEQTEIERRFINTAEAWLRDAFGAAVIHARADHDESACHVHAILMPLAQKDGGQVMLQPSAHPLIETYEHFQDAIGEAFSELGLVRGERRAQAIREAKAKARAGEDVAIPTRRQHVPPRVWREAETARLAKEAEEQAATAAAQAAEAARLKVEQARLRAQGEAVARQQVAVADAGATVAQDRQRLARVAGAQRQREVRLAANQASQDKRAAELQARAGELAATAARQQAEQAHLRQRAAEQDSFTAAAEALAAGLIDVEQAAPPVPRAEADKALLCRIRRSPEGLRRFISAVSPAFARMREQASAKAKAEVQRDREEIDGLWAKLKEVARVLDPSTARLPGREAIDQVIARWRMLAARPGDRRKPGEPGRD